MLFQDLLTQIKTESRVQGDDSFTLPLLGIINELFKEAVESERPFELRQDVDINLTTAPAVVTLPADFFLHHRITFKDANTGRQYQLNSEDKPVQPAPRGMFGHPKSYELITGSPSQIVLKPFDQIVAGDRLNLVYFKKPPEVTVDMLIQQNPLPRLEPFLIRGAIRRMRIIHIEDQTAVQMLTGDVGSAAQSYTKDEPKRN